MNKGIDKWLDDLERRAAAAGGDGAGIVQWTPTPEEAERIADILEACGALDAVLAERLPEFRGSNGKAVLNDNPATD